MSGVGTRLDVIATRVRSALGLSVGDARVERKAPLHEWWTTPAELLPHGYVHSPGMTTTKATSGDETAFNAGVVLVLDGTQEQALTVLEALQVQIKTDPSLGGPAIRAHVSDANLFEMPDTTIRCLSCVVSWTEET